MTHLKKQFRWFASIALLLFILSPAWAQRGGGGGGGPRGGGGGGGGPRGGVGGGPRGGGGYQGGGYRGGSYHGGYYRGGWYGRYPYYGGYGTGIGLAIGLGGLGGYYGGYPAYYGGYGYPAYGDYSYAPTGNLSYYYPPADVANSAAAPAASTPSADGVPAGEARIRVIVPTADARVWFNDSPTTSTGRSRVFSTQLRDPNRAYSYVIRAQWTENGQVVEQVRSVVVQAGQVSVASFPQPETVPPPPGG